jgi:hypothetical protein
VNPAAELAVLAPRAQDRTTARVGRENEVVLLTPIPVGEPVGA